MEERVSEKDIPIHYVCTHEQARALIKRAERFWVSNCGCREGNPKGCQRSRSDICLFWSEHDSGSGSGKKVITRAEAEAIMKEAKDKWLVTRPFRNEARTDTDGICFCCDDCCGYFQDRDEQGNLKYSCDKGESIEQTAMDDCTHCGECEKVCYFGARKMQANKLVLDREQCYGCGLCVDVCAPVCIRLVKR
jgi:ferredoxin